MIQEIFKFILPQNFFQKIEGESKKWFFECECAYTKAIWEAGGIRAYAVSLKKKIWGRCPNCKKYKFFGVIRKV